MPIPTTFDGLVNTVYDTVNNKIIVTPMTNDGFNSMSHTIMNSWLMWEMSATAIVNALQINRDPALMGRITRIPDSVAARSTEYFRPLVSNMPLGARR